MWERHAHSVDASAGGLLQTDGHDDVITMTLALHGMTTDFDRSTGTATATSGGMSKRTSSPVMSVSPSCLARPRKTVAVAHAAIAALAVTAASAGCAKDEAATTEPPKQETTVAVVTDAGADSGTSEVLCKLSGPPLSQGGEELVFADEFDGNAVDTTKWAVADGDKRAGTILNTSTPDMVQVRDGSLFVSADRTPAGSAKAYTAGFLDARGSYARTYGKFEFRARFPTAVGVWYAIWATPLTQPFPEIDVEITNITTPQLWLVNHWAAPPLPANSRRTYFVAPKDAKDTANAIDFGQFHTYTMIWKPGLLELKLDGETKLTRTTQGVPDVPLAWKINSWVGGWTGAPNDSTPFPVTFEVDWMHVYRLDGVIADPSVTILNKRAQYSRTETVQIALADFDEACAHVEMYDGTTLVKTKSSGGLLRFPLSSLKAGQHKLSFIATDGTRSTVASVDALIQ